MAENSQVYAVFIIRRDGNHITALETDNFEEAHSIWKNLKDSWSCCVKEQLPFELVSPMVTAFDPGLISEISIRVLIPSSKGNINNPYEREMRSKGLTETLDKFRGYDLLDKGYKLD